MKTREWKRSGIKSRHHLKPKSRGGESIESNLIDFDRSRHDAWHFLFSNLTLDEVIELLTRLKRAKEAQRFRRLLKLRMS